MTAHIADNRVNAAATFLALAILFLFGEVPAQAQQNFGDTNGYAITTCGSPPVAYHPSTTTDARDGPISIDANGLLCVNIAAGSVSLAGTTSNASSGVATSGTNLATVAYTYGFNGTTWDQLQVDGSKNLKVVFGSAQTVTVASATTPVSTMNSASANAGVNAAVAAVFDDAAPTAITENSFGFVRMSANRNLYGTLRDAAGNERGANVDANSNLNAAAVPSPSSTATYAIIPTVSGSAGNNLVLKASPGNVYSASATNLTTTAGFLVLLNLTASPGDGAITPLACAPLPASGAASINYGDFAARFGTGITAVVTSANTCFTKTTGVITAFISGQVQ